MASPGSFVVTRDHMPNAVLSVPPDGSADAPACIVQEAMRCAFGLDAPVVRGAALPAAPAAANVIAFGCLADNPFIERLYLRFRTLVDRWYPGVGGVVLQSIHPAGDSTPNVLVAGGSNAAGVAAAAQRLADRIALAGTSDLGWVLEVQLGSEHRPLPEDRMDQLGGSASPVPTPSTGPPPRDVRSAYAGGSVRDHLLRLGMYGPNVDNSHFCRSSQFALRYLYTGDPEDGARYRETFLDEIRLGVTRSLYHYKSVRMFQLWELLAPSPVFGDGDRARIDDAIRDYLLHGTGVAAIDKIKGQSTPTGIFDRHTACDALNLWIGADYFLRLTGDGRWAEYRGVADEYFRQQAGTDVPYTGLTEGYFSYLEVILEWLHHGRNS